MVHKINKTRTTRGNSDDDLMEDAEAVNLAADWADISQGLRKDLGHQLHSQWIKPIQVGGINKKRNAGPVPADRIFRQLGEGSLS